MINNYFKVLCGKTPRFFFFGDSVTSESGARKAALAVALMYPGAPRITVFRETPRSWPIFSVGDTGEDVYRLSPSREPIGRQPRIDIGFLRKRAAE